MILDTSVIVAIALREPGYLRDFGVVPVVFGEQHWREALDAFRRFWEGEASSRPQFRGLPELRRCPAR